MINPEPELTFKLWHLITGISAALIAGLSGGFFNPVGKTILKPKASKEDLDRHEAQDSKRFEEVKDFIKESETRITTVVETNCARNSLAIEKLSDRTDKKLDMLEKTFLDERLRRNDG